MFLQLLVSAVTIGCIYALVGLSFSIIFSSTRILNFSLGQVTMLGGLFGVTYYSNIGLPYVLVLVLTIITVAVIGVIIQQLTIEPLIRRNANPHSLILITLGLAMLLTDVSAQVWGKNRLHVEAPLGTQVIDIFGMRILPQSLLVIGVTIITLLLVWYFYEFTHTGKSFRAVSINRDAAKLMGINVGKVVVISFALSAGLAALAGLIMSPLVPTGTYMGTSLGIKGFSAAVIGGLGSNPGAVLGGLIIGFVETYGAGYISAGYRDAFAFLAMLLILFIKPSGLLGKKIM